MKETLKQKIEVLYRELLTAPLEVTEIFNDFYGEERVELQPMSFEEFAIVLKGYTMYEITESYGSFEISSYMRNHYDEELIILYRGIANESTLIDSEEIFDKFAPYMKVFIGNKFFNDIPIIIHFPHVTITNEFNKSVEVNNLWAQVPITWKGKGKGWFHMNRSEYDISHMEADYMHSHVDGIDLVNFDFRSVCTGSGPINNTLSSLSVDFDAPLWQLFCLELERYMGTESISGVPYRRMENIGANGKKIDNFTVNNENYYISIGFNSFLEEFFKYVLKSNILKFNYRRGSYGLSTSFIDTVLDISNAFIDWFNDQFRKISMPFNIESLLEEGIIKKVIIANGAIYDISYDSDENYSKYIGRKVLTFKGNDVNLVIKGIVERVENTSIILNVTIIERFIEKVLELLNCEYGNSKKENSGIDKKKTRFIL